MHLVHGISRWRDRWDRFEAAVGLVAAFVLVFGPLTIAALTLIFALLLAEWSVAAVAITVTAVTCPMALWLARMAERALKEYRSDQISLTRHSSWPELGDDADPRRKPPFAIVLASTLPPLPRIARVPLAVWWFAHFLAGTALVSYADVLAREGVLWRGFADGLTAVVFGYLFHFAANVFLVLGVTALFGSSTVTMAVWKKRFVIDALVTLPLLLRMLV